MQMRPQGCAGGGARGGSGVLGVLRSRELGLGKPGRCPVGRARRLYEWVAPSRTIQSVAVPDVVFRKFSSDGKRLVCFSRSLHDLVVYPFTGHAFCTRSAAAKQSPPQDEHSARAVNADGNGVAGQTTDREQQRDETTAFGAYFSAPTVTPLCTGAEVLCKDFLIEVLDGAFVIVASSLPLDDHGVLHGMHGSNDAVAGVPMTAITLHLVRASDGKRCDSRTFDNDFMHLSHNSAVAVCDDLVAVLSVRHQHVHLLQVRPAGLLVDVRTVGPDCYEDDELTLHMQREAEARFRQEQQQAHGTETPASMPAIPSRQSRYASILPSYHHRHMLASRQLGGLQQRILAFIYRNAERDAKNAQLQGQHGAAAAALRRFYHHFRRYAELVMWRVQLLDRSHLLLKLASAERDQPNADVGMASVFFAVYNFHTTEVVSFFHGGSGEFLELFCAMPEFFCGESERTVWERYATSYIRQYVVRQTPTSVQSATQTHSGAVAVPSMQAQRAANARWRASSGWGNSGVSEESGGVSGMSVDDGSALGGSTDIGTRAHTLWRTLSQWAMTPQAINSSPYFDQALFRYDDKLVSPNERARPCFDHAIKFVARARPSTLRFRMNPFVRQRGDREGRSKTLVAYVFHPKLPFVLSSVQSILHTQTVNIHIHAGTT